MALIIPCVLIRMLTTFPLFYRIAELSDDVGRLRPPRRFHSDKIIRPYSLVEASGYAILQVNFKLFTSILNINSFSLD